MSTTALSLHPPKAGQFGPPPQTAGGDFEGAFAAAVQLDETYTTPDQTLAMMESHATIATWAGKQITCWCQIPQLHWGVRDLAKLLGIPTENILLGLNLADLTISSASRALTECEQQYRSARPFPP